MFKINALNNLFVQFFDSINKFVYNIVPDKNYSYGLAIIILTIIIKTLLVPFSIKQIKSSVLMNALQPELKKLQTKLKSDPQKLQQETMKLYKEKNVNPFGGCLLLIIQYPILIALYYVFYSLHIKGIGFLWIHDLSQKATFSNWTTWILPIVSGATTYLSGILTMPPSSDPAQRKQTTTMNIGMSIFLLWMSWNFSAALVLYWTVSNLFQMAQSKIIITAVTAKLEAEKNSVEDSSNIISQNIDNKKNKKNKKK
ncbi:YidC/Oxa1 family membrane protein insertase [Clostridium acetobutylicum]|uniref:Membrane protein insertase YidC n=1 Tax=Clostridium acetobutylicum (strain ATCC 824 / DSM 792 / JCM 1419 / IAM 19013 / LMG 5710 / NBRC 13948 / NRRL B-527 / VKM B-1787 / 2291 / W) TaxID=272562 RepID=YIDC_CLOAB|nr:MULTISPECIES: membrane protein insertase YidC [Clostridium]Q97CW0.1 RecName: Full=Membrane protein insertase YidC; AltName: Full=Foldase YidC; AltName: Full=Membrane integrase YidC; AltName: Full=Membrane protein YidC [Clostridium acetobutylicum ATCC 824]AAK81656.1 Inner membrane protein, SpoIIIJ [Clostridium acetobutylicum ATCC 824]ADZ22780.1 putative inner membrane protein translocase component YidC [Clostridium acetobutylicum EA 2018]AEI33031.1 putative inner membrane protein translocase 